MQPWLICNGRASSVLDRRRVVHLAAQEEVDALAVEGPVERRPTALGKMEPARVEVPRRQHHRDVALHHDHVSAALGPADLLGQPAELSVEDTEPDARVVQHEHVDGDQRHRVGEGHGVRRPLGRRTHGPAVVRRDAVRPGEAVRPDALAMVDQVVPVVRDTLVEATRAPAVVELAGAVVEQLVVADRRVEGQPARREQVGIEVVVDARPRT